MISTEDRVKIKINELDESKVLSGKYNYAEGEVVYAPLYCLSRTAPDTYDLVLDINGEQIYVLV